MGSAEGSVAGSLTGVGLFGRIVGRRVERPRAAAAAEIGLRDRSGRSSRLLRRWRHGFAALSPGLIVFEPLGPLGIRFKRSRGEPITIEVRGVERDVRRISGIETLWANGVVHEIVTSEGRIEMVCGALQDDDWVINQILPPRDGRFSSQ